MKVPFVSFAFMHQPIKGEMMQAFESFYDSNWFVLGERVKQFEKEYAAFNQVPEVIGVSNGLDALFIALKTLGIGAGDEVIVPSNTYIATWLAVSYTGATPVPVEPDVQTYNINPALIEAAITSKTKAIMPVHLYGQACEMKAIIALAEKHGLHIVEDNAQAQGAMFQNQLTGSFGAINGTSFYPGKNLGALGDAGAVTCTDPSLASNARILRNYGSQKKYYNEVIGYNMRLDECQAAFLSVKLKYLGNWTKQRQEAASWYNEFLQQVEGVITPSVHPEATHVYHLYVVRTPQRDALQTFLAENGVDTLIHYPVPPHLQDAYKDMNFAKGSFPVAEELAETSLSLPMYPGIKREEVQYVSELINKFLKQ